MTRNYNRTILHSDMLTTSEFCDTAEEASEKVSDLLGKYNQLRPYFVPPEPRDHPVEIPAVLVVRDAGKDYGALAKQLTEVVEGEGSGLDRKTTSTISASSTSTAAGAVGGPSKKLTRAERELKARSRKLARKELSKKATAFEKAAFIEHEMNVDLEDAKVASTHARRVKGRYNGALETGTFTLHNPGGGAPLLESASCTLVRGRRYGLIGRNGKGKSTLLRALAARRVGNIPDNVSVHYVNQDVTLTDETRDLTPVECVLMADTDRKLLLEEESDLSSGSDLTEEEQRRLNEVIEELQAIGSDSAERRAIELLGK